MPGDAFAAAATPEYLCYAKRVAPVVLLALFWFWETWRPFFGRREGRLGHAGRNLAVAVLNAVAMGLLFGYVTVTVTAWTDQHQVGLLNSLRLDWPVKFALGLVLLDAWMYAWHRANHAVPLLWRFHRTHHSDPAMDVTTATRFHPGEHVGASVLKLGLIPLLGFEVWHLLAYDTLVLAATQFHHADVSLGRWDGWLRLVIVTPDMHKVHHSDRRDEADSNYAVVLSIWDRVFGSFRWRDDPGTIVFGLKEFTDPGWQTVGGMLRTPFVEPRMQPALEAHPDRADDEMELVAGGGRLGRDET